MLKQKTVILLFFISAFSFAQTKKEDAYKPEWKRDTVIADNIFRLYNSWISAGAGFAKNPKIPTSQFTGGVDFNFHITKEYFQAGFLLSGDGFGNYNNQQLHVCYGKRQENFKYNLAYFGGLSYSRFYLFKNNVYALDYTASIGLYVSAQLIRKITYDVGIGVEGFADINSRQSLFGLKGVLYFSGAFKGKK